MNEITFYSTKSRSTIFYYFFLFFVFEACIGGSGNLIQYKGFSLRKIDFSIALLITFLIIFYLKKVNKEVFKILCYFSITVVIGTVIGLINYGLDKRVSENLLMQSFFFLLPFYSLFIKTEKDISTVIKIIKFASICMALVYLAILFLIAVGVFNFLTLYAMIYDSIEFMGRGENAFWYKGFLYLCLGIFFFDGEKNMLMKRLKQLIVLTAVYFTFTRGFILAIFAAIFIYYIFFRSFIKGVFIFIFSFLLFSFLSGFYEASSFDRTESDQVRKIQIYQVLSDVDPVSFIIGHGFGKGVPIRDNHMEINFLEIFHKQGLIGLIFWFSILFYIVVLYINCKKKGYEKQARPFLLSVVFVYVQSATNPYLTNSIGLNMIMISILSLNVYKQNKTIENPGLHPATTT